MVALRILLVQSPALERPRVVVSRWFESETLQAQQQSAAVAPWCMVGTCLLLMLVPGDWPSPSLRWAPWPSSRQLHQTLLVLFESCGHSCACSSSLHCASYFAVQEALINLSTYLAPAQSPTVPARLRTTYVLLPVYALPLRHMKYDTTDALRRTGVSRLVASGHWTTKLLIGCVTHTII